MPVGRRSNVWTRHFLKQIAPHLLAGAALEQHVVGHHHRRTEAMNLHLAEIAATVAPADPSDCANGPTGSEQWDLVLLDNGNGQKNIRQNAQTKSHVFNPRTELG